MIGLVRNGSFDPCNESRQKLICHRYDYTGLTGEESFGMGWKLSFHPDDMVATNERWQHSLETGDPYNTEYRCLSKDGKWRWMLGRALPMRNNQTGKIEKWFGTCTDIHQAVENRFAARRIVSNRFFMFIRKFM